MCCRVIIYLFQGNREKKTYVLPSQGGRKEGFIMTTEKFCTRCGKKFIATGREVICPACKQAAAEESKKAAVLRAKKASWAGESVPVRISGRASTVIREFSKAHDVPFAEALDALLQASDFFKSTGKAWEEVTPYKSRRRDKRTTEDAAGKPQDAPQAGKQAAKVASKQATGKAASKNKAAAGKGDKA